MTVSATTQPAAPAPRRRRRGGVIAIVVIVVVLVLLAIAAVVADGIARGAIRDEVADRVRTTLELEPDHPVDVDIAGASVLLQAAAGRFERVTVDAGEIEAGDLRGSLVLEATGIPTDLTAPTERVEATLTVAESDLPAIASALSNAQIEDVVLEEGEIRFRSALDLLGIPLEFVVGLVPEAVGGALTFTPSTLALNDEQIDLAQFADQFGGLGDGLLQTQTVCVAERLPRDLVLEGLDVADDALSIRLGADDAVLDGPGFTERGSC